ncbi:MAG: ABC transporter permease, partial [Candidatus Latescibacteria bacterium]|nr:ABC transporter permease [Candidatus Latescibacterota bacterium]
NVLAGKKFVMDYNGNFPVLLGLLGIGLFVAFVSGSYPAFFLSAFQPADVLKGTLKASSRNPLFRSVLVVLQFAISIGLIIGTGIVYDQLNYIRNKRLGFQKEHVIVLPIRGQEVRKNYEAIKSRLLQHSDILSVSASSSMPGGLMDKSSIRPEGAQDELASHTLSIDHDFIEMLKIELAAGRNFSKDFAAVAKEAILLNEAAVRRFGWESPKNAIGKRATLWGRKWTVIGVVKDFHISSLHDPIEPLVLYIRPDRFCYLSVRIRPGHISETLDFLKHSWDEFSPNRPFEYSFLDDSFDKLYRAEDRLGKIFGSFSLIAILIACLGLFGLASFATEQRTKEIGIRKILGASVSGIVLLLSKEFTKLVLVSNLIAWPVAYWAMNRWLQDFAYRIPIGVGTFLLAGVIALVIALLTVSFQAIKAATANPVKALRYE